MYTNYLLHFADTPPDYEPSAFMPCENTYVFKKPAVFYHIGHVASDVTAMSLDLRTMYIKPTEVDELNDLLLEQVGYKENDKISPMDITGDGSFSYDMVCT